METEEVGDGRGERWKSPTEKAEVTPGVPLQGSRVVDPQCGGLSDLMALSLHGFLLAKAPGPHASTVRHQK